MHDAAIIPVAAPTAAGRPVTRTLLWITDTVAASLLTADLAVVIYSVLARSNGPTTSRAG
jgi:hypothetical protein